ncbi:MAG: recombination protein O N-terminal domain-containing protein [Bacteroidetes bacterium]|nr:recombination protein O N-terminal domain-containing protein [Bacteroidota bacterium]
MSPLHTTRAIVLRAFRHGDNSVVLKAYTEAFGARTYVARTGKRGAARPAYLQPLARVELVVTESRERDMHRIQEARLRLPYGDSHTDQARAAVLLFMQEVFYRTLREESPDTALFNCLEQLLAEVDTGSRPGMLPLLVLLRLAKHLGFLPELPQPGEDRFDMQEGWFFRGPAPHAHCMEPPIASVLAELLRAEINGDDPLIGGAARRELLDQLLVFFRMHVEGFGQLRSPEVLHALLH